MKKKILILLPTLNEVHHIVNLYNKISNLNIKANILFVDDGSTDGTWKEIIKIKKKNKSKVFAIKRDERKGLGKAHKDGLNWAYNKNYSFLVTMDTDFAHDPKYIPKLINEIKKNDLVIGSRHLKKKSTPNWNPFRLFLNKAAYLVSYILFNHNYDSTNAFRCYNLRRINRKFISYCKSNDYDFFFTSLTILNFSGYKISQIPMVIKGRTAGNSKMKLGHMIKSVYMMFSLFFKIKFVYSK